MKVLQLIMKVARKFFVSLTIILMYSLWFSLWEWLDIEVIPGKEVDDADRGFLLMYFMITSTFVISFITLILEYVWKVRGYWFINVCINLLISYFVMIFLEFEWRVFPVVCMIGMSYPILDFLYHLLGKYAFLMIDSEESHE